MKSKRISTYRNFKLLNLLILSIVSASFAGAAGYPDNAPNLDISRIAGNRALLFQLQPDEKVEVKTTFDGTATGCAVYIHNVGTGVQVVKHAHPLDRPHEEHVDVLNGPGAFLLSIWTFVGGPPIVAPPPPAGWSQVAQSTSIFPPSPNSFLCQGSAHGPTSVGIVVHVR
jgi:hypothetical protein